MKIPLSKPDIGDREIELVTEVLRSGQLSLGPRLAQFEEKFAEQVGRRYAVAVSSGTAALHLSVIALGLGPDDEVLTTPFSFVASANCLLYEQVAPSFVDIDPATLNIDPGAVRDAIEEGYVRDERRNVIVNRLTGRVLRAILPVHIFGLPCEMQEILQIAAECGLYVIEDACEALGAEFSGRQVGSFSNAATFAFYPNKQITTGEGGMIVTDDPDIAKVCRSMRNQGRDESAEWLRHDLAGYNYRLSDLHCAVGLAQLERLDELMAARTEVAALYNRFLDDIPQISLPYDPPGTRRSWFVYPILLKGAGAPLLRDHLMAGLRTRGIGCQAYFPAIHRQPYFERIRLLPSRPLPLAESAAARCLALPFFSSMSEDQVAQVCAAVREILSEAPAASRHTRIRTIGRAKGAA